MPTIALRNIGLEGLQKDAPEQDLPANGVTSATNVRIRDRTLSSWPDVSNSITFLETENPLFADAIWRARDVLSGVIVVLADELLGQFAIDEFSSVFLVDGQVRVYFYDTDVVRTEIGPLSPLENSLEWHGSKNAETYILNNGKLDLPHTWDTTDVSLNAMIPMVGWPANYTCSFMDSFKNFIVAGDVQVDGNDRFGLVKWSHPRAPGDSQIFWDFTDPTILAGENDLAVSSREMTGIQQLKDLMMIYFDRLVVRMQFVGGQFVMNFETVFRDDGAVSARSMVEVNGVAFVFGTKEVYQHDGYQKTSISDLRMTRHIQNNTDPKRAVDVAYYAINNEVMFLVRTPVGQTELDGDRIFVFNLIHNAWTEVDVTTDGLPAVALLFTGPNLIEGELVTTWETITGGWDEQGALNWGGTVRSADREALYALSLKDNVLYDFDSDASDGSALFRTGKTLIQHTHIDLDDQGEAVGDRVIYVNRAYPQLRGEGSVQMRFGVHATAQSPIDWVASIPFKISKVAESDPDEEDADYAVDFRMAGRYLSYEIRPIGDARFTFSGMDIEVEKVSDV